MLSIAANGCLCWGAEGRFCLCAGLQQPRQPGLGGCSLQTFIQRLFWGFFFFGAAQRTLVFAFQTVLGYLSVRCSKKKACSHTGPSLGSLTDCAKWFPLADVFLCSVTSTAGWKNAMGFVCFWSVFWGGNEGQVFLESRTHHRKNHPLICIRANPDLF